MYISANLMGLFFISLILFDIITNDWSDLPLHAGIGIIVTFLYFLVCNVLGEAISSAILFVPAIFLFAFILASWLLRNNLLKQNCCINCKGVSKPPCNPVPSTPIPKKCNPLLV
jgi:hypothetical protein